MLPFASFWGWEPDRAGSGPAVRIFADAARCALTTGSQPSYCVGLWGLRGRGLVLRLSWLTAQPVAELYGVLVVLEEVHAGKRGAWC